MRSSLFRKLFYSKPKTFRHKEHRTLAFLMEQLEGREVPANLYVNAAWLGTTPGTEPPDPGPAGLFGTDSFATIQDAVNAASNGDTINVAAGTYGEAVTVNKSVTILGAQSGVDARSRTGASESIVDDPAGSTAFYITASGVTINGFTVEGNTNPNVYGFGIVMSPSIQGTQILDNIIQDNIAGLDLANNGSQEAVIQYNLFLNNNQPGPGSGQGIYTDQYSGGIVSNVLIDNNAFVGQEGSGIGFSSTAAQPDSNITISNNTFNDNGQGLYAFDLANSTIAANTFENSTNSSYADLWIFEGSSNLTISNNLLENGAGYAFEVSQGDDGPANAQNITFSDNSISGYTGGSPTFIVDPDSYTGTLNASGNWWGVPLGTGPADPTGATNIAGLISGNVTVGSYLSSGTNGNASAPGFQVSASTQLWVPSPNANSTVSGTLQEAIDAAPTGGTVLVAPGTYSGPLFIDHAITLAGVTGNPADVVIDPSGPGITVSANGVTISNMTVSNGTDGIYANGATGLTITNVIADDNSNDGVDLLNMGGNIALSNVTLTQNGNDGLYSTASGSAVLTLANVAISNNTGAGLVADGYPTYDLSDLTLTGDGDAGGSSINPTLAANSTLNYTATAGTTPYAITAGPTQLQFTSNPSGPAVASEAIALASIGQLNLAGGSGADSFLIAPAPSGGTAINVAGGLPNPSANPGDVLTLNLAGVTGTTLSDTYSATGYAGTYSFTNRANITFSEIETLTNANSPPTIAGTVAGQKTNDHSTVDPFSTATIADGESQPVTVTITLSNSANGVFSAASLTASGFVSDGGGVYSFSGTTTDATTAIRQLAFAPTIHQVTPGQSVTTTFSIAVNDGLSATVTNSKTTVVALSLNDPPVISGTAAGQTVTDETTVAPFSTVTIADPDVGQMETVSIALSNPQNGTFSAASLAASGFALNTSKPYEAVVGPSGITWYYPFTYTGSPSQVTAAIQQLVFVPTAHQLTPGSTGLTTFTISVSDGIATTTDSTTTVLATAVNDSPTIVGTVANQAVNDNSTVSPFGAVVFGDVDVGQTYTVTIAESNPANGVLGPNTGLAGGFASLGNGVYQYVGSYTGATAAIQKLVFTPTDHQASPGNTTTTDFSIAISDGIATTSDSTASVIATAVNTPPAIAGTRANQAVTDAATVQPFSATTIADPDAGAMETVTITLSNSANGVFSAASLTASGFVSSGGGVYTFTGSPSVATAALHELVFVPTAHQVAPNQKATTTFTLSVNDGSATATNATTTVVATAVNDPPAISGTAINQAVTDAATVQPFSNVTITDPDFGQTETVTISFTAANGTLSTSSGFASLGGGVYRYAGTPAQVTTAIQALVFTPTQYQTSPGNSVVTKFTISVSDGLATTTNSATTVIATAVNDPPTISGAVASQAVNDNATIYPFSGVTIADPDYKQTETVTITLSNAADGTLKLAGGFSSLGGGVYKYTGSAAGATSATHQLIFVPTLHQVTPGTTVTTTFTIAVNDGFGTTTDNTTSVVATAVNDPPTITGTTANQGVTDITTVLPFRSVTIGDVDYGQTEKVTIALSDPSNGAFSAASLTASGFTNMGGGVYCFSGSASAATTAIRQLAFVPTAHQVTPGAKVSTTFTLSVFDGIATTVNATASASATATNTRPTITGAPATQSVAYSPSGTAVFAAAAIADPDFGQTQSVAITVTNPISGAFSAASLTASGFVSLGSGKYIYSGSAANATAAIQQLVFVPTAGLLPSGKTSTTIFTISDSDGVTTAANASSVLYVTY